jgi:DNA polymerase III subunit beta
MLLIKTKRDTLLAPLQAVSGIVERRHTLPILSNVFIEKKGGRLSFLATDIEIQISTAADCEAAGEDYSLTVGARKLQDLLRALPDDAEVSLNAQERKLAIKSGKSRFNLQTLPADDFPRMAEAVDEAAHLSVPQKTLKRLFALVQCAMAQQDIRYYLNGLLFIVDGNSIKLVATDGHRLAYASASLTSPVTRREVIVPRKTVVELSKLLDDSEDPVELEISPKQIRFSFSNIVLISKLVDGKYPDYMRVMQAVQDKKVALNRLELLHTLQRASILTNEKFRGVRCVLSANSLKIICSNAEQEEAQEELEVPYAGDGLDIGFNVGYLLDCLNTVDTADIEWSFGDANTSALITMPGNENYKYVVMPMRI